MNDREKEVMMACINPANLSLVMSNLKTEDHDATVSELNALLARNMLQNKAGLYSLSWEGRKAMFPRVEEGT